METMQLLKDSEERSEFQLIIDCLSENNQLAASGEEETERKEENRNVSFSGDILQEYF